MAEVTVKKLEEQLNCSICLGTYTDPKILQCFHVYCQKCLEKLVIQDQQGQLSLSCPICRHIITPVPASGIAGLQSAFHINRLLEIVEEVKTSKEKAESEPKRILLCSDHAEREVELFCEKCGVCICPVCAILGGKHHSHHYKTIAKSFQKYATEMAASLRSLEEQIKHTATKLAKVDECCSEINNQHAIMEAKIHDKGRQLHETIETRQKELLCQLNQITGRKIKNLESEKIEIKTLHAKLNSCFEFTRESLNSTGIQQCEVLAIKTNLVKQAQELVASSNSTTFQGLSADLDFSPSAEYIKTIYETYGKLFAPSLPNPARCSILHISSERRFVTAILKAVSFNGVPYNDRFPTLTFKASLVSGSSEVACSIIRTANLGQYFISGKAVTTGYHKLHVLADGQHVKTSPLSLFVKSEEEFLETHLELIKQFETNDFMHIATNLS